MVQNKLILYICLALIWPLLGLVSGCTKDQETAGISAATTPPLPTVAIAHPQQKNWLDFSLASGKVLAAEEIIIKSKFSSSTDLQQVLVKVGDKVARGQVLAKLDAAQASLEVRIQRARVAGKKAQLAKSVIKTGQDKALEKVGAISANEVLDEVTTLKTDRADLEFEQASLAQKELNLTYAIISAPESGIISAQSATIGSTITSGSELFKLLSTKYLEWQAEINLKELANIRPGQQVSVTTPQGQQLQGTVRQISPQLNPKTASGMAYVNLPFNTTLLKVGMYLNGQISTGSHQAWVVPNSAIITKNGYAYVLKIESAQQVIPLKVQLGRASDSAVEVISANIQSTDTLVASGGEFLNEGDKVNIAAGDKSK